MHWKYFANYILIGVYCTTCIHKAYYLDLIKSHTGKPFNIFINAYKLIGIFYLLTWLLSLNQFLSSIPILVQKWQDYGSGILASIIIKWGNAYTKVETTPQHQVILKATRDYIKA